MTVEVVPYGVNDMKVAVRNSGGSYGTALDVWGVRNFEVTVETISKRLEGDDVILRAHSRIIAAQIRCSFAFKDLAIYAALTGRTVVSGNSMEYVEITNSSPPYLGLVAQILADDEQGDFHIFAPMAKSMSGFTLRAQYGEFVTPELTFDCVKDDFYNTIIYPQTHENTTAITIPPSFS